MGLGIQTNSCIQLCARRRYAKAEIKTYQQKMQVLVYNLSASEKMISQIDAHAATKQQRTREMRLTKLDEELKTASCTPPPLSLIVQLRITIRCCLLDHGFQRERLFSARG